MKNFMKKAIALILVVLMVVPVFPLELLAKQDPKTAEEVAATPMSEEQANKIAEEVLGDDDESFEKYKTADGKIDYDKAFADKFPYGTFAFGDLAGEVKEGAIDGAEGLYIPVYRIGSTKGAAIAFVDFSPNVTQDKDGNPIYMYAASAQNDIKISYEDDSDIAYDQALAYPRGIAPAPDGVELTVTQHDDEETGSENGMGVTLSLSIPENESHQVLSYQWQCIDKGKTAREWVSPYKSNEAELQVDLNEVLDDDGMPVCDYRLIYETGDGFFCTPSLFTEQIFDPQDIAAKEDIEPVLEGTELSFREIETHEEFESYDIPLVFADGENVKLIKVEAIDDSEYELDEIGIFSLTATIGAQPSDISDSFSVTVRDNDKNDMRESNIGFTVSSMKVSKEDETVTIEVERTGDTRYLTTVEYATEDGSAKAGEHFTETKGELMFTPASDKEIIEVPLITTSGSEEGIDFSVNLSNPKGGDGKCELENESIVIELPEREESNIAENGIVGEGKTLSNVIASIPASNNASSNMSIADGGLLSSETDNKLDVSTVNRQADESQKVEAILKPSNKFGTYNYGAISFTRSDDYDKNTLYWKDIETPYYDNEEERLTDCGNIQLEPAEFNEKGGNNIKSGGHGSVKANYDTTKPASINITNAGSMFSDVGYSFKVLKVVRASQFLGFGWNFTLPWINVLVGGKEVDYYNFGPQKRQSEPVKYKTYKKDKFDLNYNEDFVLNLNMTLNDSGEGSRDHEKFKYVPKDCSELQLSTLNFTRRVFTDTKEVALRIYTANDADHGESITELPAELYNDLKPEVVLAENASGVTAKGQLYAGSQLKVKVGDKVASYKAYGAGSKPDEAVFVTQYDSDGNEKFVPAKVEYSGNNVYLVTLLWDNMTKADYSAHYRINVVYERDQKLNLDVSKSLIRDEMGNQKLDEESVAKTWDNILLDENGNDRTVTITYSRYDGRNSDIENRFKEYTETITARELFNVKSTSPIGTYSPEDKMQMTDIQKIKFNGFPDGDIIVFCGEEYEPEDTITLSADEFTAANLTLYYYQAKYLTAESTMTTVIDHIEYYYDGNANGKIDGYYDEHTGQFTVDENSGDMKCGFIEDSIPEDLIPASVNLDGGVRQYYFKLFYATTPRALRGGDDSKTAQVIPAYVPQQTDESSLAELSKEQKSVRMVSSGGTVIHRYDKKNEKPGAEETIADTSEGHPIFGSAATRQTILDMPLGGDIGMYRDMLINGEPNDFGLTDYAGNLKFDYDNPSGITITDAYGRPSSINRESINDFLGSFVNATTFVVGIQETKKMTSQKDFEPESIANGNIYATPAENTSTSLAPSGGADIDGVSGNQDTDITSMSEMKYDAIFPDASFSLAGLKLTFLNTNQLIMSFGIPIKEDDLDAPKKEQEVREEGGNKISTEKVDLGSEKNEVEQVAPAGSDNNVPSEEHLKHEENLPSGGGKGGQEILNSEVNKDANGSSGSVSIQQKNDKGEVVKQGDIMDLDDDDLLSQEKEAKKNTTRDKILDKAVKSVDMSDFADFIENGSGLKNFWSDPNRENDPEKMVEKAKTRTISLEFYGNFLYNSIDNEWQMQSFTITGTISWSYYRKWRWPSFPAAYIFLSVSFATSLNAGTTFERDYAKNDEIISQKTELAAGEKLEFKTELEDDGNLGFGIVFDGAVNFTVKFTDSSEKPLFDGAAYSDGTKERFLKFDDKRGNITVTIEALEDTTISKVAGIKAVVNIAAFTTSLYGEFNFEFGAGVGIPCLKFELFGNINVKSTIFNYEYGETPDLPLDFSFKAAAVARAKVLCVEFSKDLIGFCGYGNHTGMDPFHNWEWDYYWEDAGHEHTNSNEEVLAKVTESAPTTSVNTQSFYNALYTPQEAAENAYRPTDTDVKFELSGYGGAGDAFKLADHLNTAYDYEAININGDTYILYMISDPGFDESNDNAFNATRIALSKVVTMGEEPGIRNPVDDTTGATPYILIDPTSNTGDTEFTFSVDGTKLNVTYMTYGKHFEKGEKLDAQTVGQYTVTKTASIDLAEDKAFSTPVVVSSSNQSYRTMPTTRDGISFYGETISTNANSMRTDTYKQYLKARYNLTDSDFTAETVDAEKADHVFAYKTFVAQKGLMGDGSSIVAATPDGKAATLEVGKKTGEVLTSLKVEKIDGKYLAVYITEQDAYFDPDGHTVLAGNFNENTDYARINRLCSCIFDGERWSTPSVYRTIVDFEHCSDSYDGDAGYTLIDGFYSKDGALENAYNDPTMTNINLIEADLDGKGVSPICTVEINTNTYLIDNAEMKKLVNGEDFKIQGVFTKDMGTAVTMAADKDGRLALAYITTAHNTDNNAIYVAWWDKDSHSWGSGNLIAMNHMSVYEDGLKYNLTDEEMHLAYKGLDTGNAEYDAYVNSEEGKSQKGAGDRFVFSKLALLPSTVTREIWQHADPDDDSPERKPDDIITTETTEQLILLTDGVYSTYTPTTIEIEGEEVEYYEDLEGHGNGFYAIAFGSGTQCVDKGFVDFDYEDFSCGSVLTGKMGFINNGTAPIRGSAAQPITVKLFAKNPDEEYDQVLYEGNINNSIPSGEMVTFEFNAQPLSRDLPNQTKFYISVSEDEQYIEESGGTAFSNVTNPVFIVKDGAEIKLSSVDYEIDSMTDDTVTLNTSFTVSNTGTKPAEGLYVQYLNVKDEDYSENIDITGSELKVSHEQVISSVSNGRTDLSRGIIELADDTGSSNLTNGYYRYVSGQIVVKRRDFSKFDAKGMKLNLTVFSRDDEVSIDNGKHIATDTTEYRLADNSITTLIKHDTDFTVPPNIALSLGNTMRVPVNYTSSNEVNDVVVREISNGMDDWKPLFNDVYYDVSHNAVVGVAFDTGYTIIQIENRETNTFREIAVNVNDEGIGTNIYTDDKTYTFYNNDGSKVDDDPVNSQWQFLPEVTVWKEGTLEAPMRNDICVAEKEGDYFKFYSVGTTFNFYYIGDIEVSSDLFPSKTTTGKSDGTEPLTVRFDNTEGQKQEITVKALSADTRIDRFTATYPEDTGYVNRSDVYAPNIYWSRSFPNTASIEADKGNEVTIKCYVTDELGLSSIKANGNDPDNLEQINPRLWSFDYTFKENGTYTFTAADIDGNISLHTLGVHWFNKIVNKDAISTAPDYHIEGNYVLLDSKGREPFPPDSATFIGSLYSMKTGEILRGYTNGWNKIDFTGKPLDNTSFSNIPAVPGVRAGFYVLRIVAEDGTWSQGVMMHTFSGAAEPTAGFRTKDDGSEIFLAGTTSDGDHLLTVKLNGMELSPRPVGKVEYPFAPQYSGMYTVETFDGVRTKTYNKDYQAEAITMPEGGVSIKGVSDNDKKDGEVIIDADKIYGGRYISSREEAERGIYYARYQYLLLEGKVGVDEISMDDEGWQSNPAFGKLGFGTYTLAIRDTARFKTTPYLQTIIIGNENGIRVDGSLTKGSTINCVLEKASGNLNYQWSRIKPDGEEEKISGATSSTYTLTTADYMCKMRCTVTGSSLTKTMRVTTKDLVGLGVKDVELTYDGKGHTLGLDNIGSDDYEVVYSLTEEGAKTAPTFKDVGEYTANYYFAQKPLKYSEDGKLIGPYVEGTGKVKINVLDISNAVVTVDAEVIGFTGQYEDCNVTSVMVGGVEVDDYTVINNRAMEPGNFKLTVIGQGNFVGSVEKPWKIIEYDAKKDLYDAQIEPVVAHYTGKDQTVVPVVMFNGSVLPSDCYRLDGDCTKKELGEYTAYIEGTNGYTGRKEFTWTIDKRNIRTSDIKADPDPFTIPFTGKYQIPIPQSLIIDGVEAFYLEDYDLVVGEQLWPGKYEMDIVGMGPNYDVKTIEWVMGPMDLTTAEIKVNLATPDIYYTGSEQTCRVRSIIANGVEISGFYTLSNNVATEPGKYELTLTGDNKTLSGSITIPWEIKETDLSKATIELEQSLYPYSGDDITANIKSINIGNNELDPNSAGFTITGATGKDKGVHYIVVQGNNEHIKGSVGAKWAIAPTDISDDSVFTISANPAAVQYDTTQKTTTISMSAYGMNFTDFRLVGGATTGVEPGTYFATVGGENGFTGTRTVTWQIVGNISQLSVEVGEYTYNGKEQIFTPTSVSLNGRIFRDYVIEGTSSATKAGKYTAIFKGTGDYTGTKRVEWEIKCLDISNADVVVEQTVFPYTGENHDCIVKSVKVGDIEVDNYSVYNNYGIDPGNYELTVQGKGNYTGMVKIPWQIIESQDMLTAKIIPGSYTYNAKEQTFAPTIQIGGKTLSTDCYTIEGDTIGTEAGDYNVIIKGTGDYSGEVQYTWTIQPLDLSTAKVEYDDSGLKMSYAANVLTPPIPKLIVDGIELTDYDIGGVLEEWRVGKYDICYYGKGSFTGACSVSWEIMPLDLSKLQVVFEKDAYEYTGSEQTVRFAEATVDGVNAKEMIKLVGNKATEPGKYEITVTSISSYAAGSTTVPWEIVPADLTDATVEPERFVYPCTGENVTAQIKSVTIGDNTMDLSVITQKCTINGNTEKDTGVYTLTLSGDGTYFKGSVSIPWAIVTPNITDNTQFTAGLDKTEFAYDGLQKTVNISIKTNGFDFTDYKIISGTTTATEAGSYQVTIEATNGFMGAMTFNWSIGKTSLPMVNVECDPALLTFVYNGKDQQPTLNTLIIDGEEATLGIDYTIGVEPKKYAGKYKLSVYGIGKYDGIAILDWEIKPIDIETADIKVILSNPEMYYTGGSQSCHINSIIVNNMQFSGGFSYKNNTATAPGKYVLTATISAKTIAGTIQVPWEIKPADLTNATVVLESNSYQFTGEDITAKVKTFSCNGHTFVPVTSHCTISGNVEKDVGVHTLTIEGDGKYFTGSVSVPWEIVATDISDDTLFTATLDNCEFTYDGNEKTVNISMTQNGKEFTDFKVVDGTTTATKPGEYEVTIEGTNGYIGRRTLSWRIIGNIEYEFDVYSASDLTIEIEGGSDDTVLENIKGIFIAPGHYNAYRDVKSNLIFGVNNASLRGSDKYCADGHYHRVISVTSPDEYTVLIKKNDGNEEYRYITVGASGLPVVEANEITADISGLSKVRYIRFAPGKCMSAAEVKRTNGVKTVMSSSFVDNKYSFTVSESGVYTAYFAMTDGTNYLTYVTLEGIVENIGVYFDGENSDRLCIENTNATPGLSIVHCIRIAKGSYETSAEVKNNAYVTVGRGNSILDNDIATFKAPDAECVSVFIKCIDGSSKIFKLEK